MAEFGNGVGVSFLESMSGFVRGDPDATNPPGDDTGRLAYNLELRIPGLRAFLDAPVHEADIAGGEIIWEPYVPKTAVRPGRCVLYRRDPATRRRKYFDFTYAFPSGKGYDIEVEGHKYLRDDPGFDVVTDMSTVHLMLRAEGREIAKGTVTVHLQEAVRQLRSIDITGATSKREEEAAAQAFFGWMNNELRDVYPDLPMILPYAERLSREQRRVVETCIRVMLPDPLPPDGPQPDDIIASLERYLALSTAPDLDALLDGLQAAGVFLSIFGADIPLMRKAVREVLRSRDRTPVRDVIAFVRSLVVLPYYAHPKADMLVGYPRPKHRPRVGRTLPVSAAPPDRAFDVVIAGSGPAGSILAARLSKAGHSVLLLEAGPHVPEKDIATDELEAIARLYKDSGLQRANMPRDIFDQPGPTFFVLQGACVGGGAIINNAVCFRLPDHRLALWQDAGFPLTRDVLDAGFDAIGNELQIAPASKTTRQLNPGFDYLRKAFGAPKKPDASIPPEPGFYECLVNLERFDESLGTGCIGTGLCNLGCASERKRNAYQVHLPAAVDNGCVIVADARAVEVRLDPAAGGERTVAGLVVKLVDGRTVTVRARQYVLSCGPVGSTEVLLRSPDIDAHARSLRLPVGRRFSANIGSPLFVFAKTPVHVLASLQIAHYWLPPGEADGFVIETWFNPPASNAVGMPGLMNEHFARMQRYASTLAAAPLVGTRASGRVRLRDGQVRIELPIGEYEVQRLADGLSILAKAFLGSGGVEAAIAGFEGGREMKNDADVDRLRSDLLKIRNDQKRLHLLQIGTGHPMGGNAMSVDPAIGVVDREFRLRGVANLRVCDGSIFPDAAGVNPQWTIMALADRCANVIHDALS